MVLLLTCANLSREDLVVINRGDSLMGRPGSVINRGDSPMRRPDSVINMGDSLMERPGSFHKTMMII
jgi:hypothetical protein